METREIFQEQILQEIARCLIFLVLLVCSAQAPVRDRDAKAIEKAKSTKVSQIASSLPDTCPALELKGKLPFPFIRRQIIVEFFVKSQMYFRCHY